MRLLLFFSSLCFILSCKQSTNITTAAATDYYYYGDSVEAGGVKLVPIKTDVGEFKVWTKRFGNNPKIKVLLLHGGPAMTMNTQNVSKRFSNGKVSNSMNTTSWAPIIVISQRIAAFGQRHVLLKR